MNSHIKSVKSLTCGKFFLINRNSKDPSEQQLSKQQARFHLCWEGQASKRTKNKGA